MEHTTAACHQQAFLAGVTAAGLLTAAGVPAVIEAIPASTHYRAARAAAVKQVRAPEFAKTVADAYPPGSTPDAILAYLAESDIATWASAVAAAFAALHRDDPNFVIARLAHSAIVRNLHAAADAAYKALGAAQS